MKNQLRKLLRDESGIIISAELIMIMTVGVLATVVGWGAVSSMLVAELEDVGNMIGALDQTWGVSGYIACPNHGYNRPMGFTDHHSTVTIVRDNYTIAADCQNQELSDATDSIPTRQIEQAPEAQRLSITIDV